MQRTDPALLSNHAHRPRELYDPPTNPPKLPCNEPASKRKSESGNRHRVAQRTNDQKERSRSDEAAKQKRRTSEAKKFSNATPTNEASLRTTNHCSPLTCEAPEATHEAPLSKSPKSRHPRIVPHRKRSEAKHREAKHHCAQHLSVTIYPAPTLADLHSPRWRSRRLLLHNVHRRHHQQHIPPSRLDRTSHRSLTHIRNFSLSNKRTT